jgi:NAD(P)-dependent dehydrogenase (short-subunit alcohol dehydrogenase family)
MWDVEGKTAVITGPTSGLGRLAALALAERGAHLVLVCRDAHRAKQLTEEIAERAGKVHVRAVMADLSVQAQVRRAADEILGTGEPIHVLLNNAGAIFGSRRQVSRDGVEMTLALNHLAYFALTLLLLPRLRASAPARVVNVASDAYKDARGGFDFEDVNAEKKYSAIRQYALSKLANILFTRELAQRLEGTGVTANAATPPRLTATGFARNVHPLANLGLRLAAPVLLSPRKGVQSLVHLCTSPTVGHLSGTYWSGLRQPPLTPAASSATDAGRLWDLSAALTGVDG